MKKFIDSAIIRAKIKLSDFIHNENGAIDVIVMVIILGIAVLLAIIFKDRITKLLKDLFDSAETGALNLVATEAPQ